MKTTKNGFSNQEKSRRPPLLLTGRIIYGTDFPYNDRKCIRSDIETIKNSNLTQTAKENVLGASLENLLKNIRKQG